MALGDLKGLLNKGKSLVSETMNTVSEGVSNAAGTAKAKVDELGRDRRRNDLYRELGKLAYDAWKGYRLQLTPECAEVLSQLEAVVQEEAAQMPEKPAHGIQPEAPVPTLQVKPELPRRAPSLQVSPQPVIPEAPAPYIPMSALQPRETMPAAPAQPAPTLVVDEVYTSSEDVQE